MSTAEKVVPEVQEPAQEVREWLEDQQLTDTVDQLEANGYTREERTRLDIWIDRRLFVLRELVAEKAHNERVKQARVKMVADHFDGLNATLQRRIDWLTQLLTLTARAYPYPGTSKTRELPFGAIGVRTVPEKLEVQDEGIALVFAEVNAPAAVKVVHKLLKTPLMAYLKRTGIIPDGCELTERFERPYVRVHGDKEADHE